MTDPSCRYARTLPALLATSVEAHPDRVALTTVSEHITYGQLSERVEDCSRALVACGVGKGTRVGLCMENQPDWVIAALSVTGIGAILVPVSTFSHVDDLEHLLRQGDVSALLMSARFMANDYLGGLCGLVPALGSCHPGAIYSERLPALRSVIVRGETDLPRACSSWDEFIGAGESVPAPLLAQLRAEVDPEDEAYLLATSGTTARPKGVLLTHDALARNGHQIGDLQRLDPDDVVWAYFPLFFSAGCINVMLGTLSHGASLILQPSFDPGESIELIEREGATTWHLWPHQLTQLMDHPDWKSRDHSKLHKGTAPYEFLLENPPDDGVGGVNMYGMTETATAFSCTPATDPLDVRLQTQGHLMPGNEMKIVDPETGERLPEGTSGEICVKGPTVMRRYYKVDPAETFDAEGFFHSGDLGFVDADGRVHYERRIKDVIKTGGINVAPADIESTLCGIHGVRAAYVFAIADRARGEVVGAALVSEAPLDESVVLDHCKEHLPGYKRPRGILLLSPDDVPMTGSGKVQKFAIRDRLTDAIAAGGGPIVRA